VTRGASPGTTATVAATVTVLLMRRWSDASDRDRRLVENCPSRADPNARPPAPGLYLVDAGRVGVRAPIMFELGARCTAPISHHSQLSNSSSAFIFVPGTGVLSRTTTRGSPARMHSTPTQRPEGPAQRVPWPRVLCPAMRLCSWSTTMVVRPIAKLSGCDRSTSFRSWCAQVRGPPEGRSGRRLLQLHDNLPACPCQAARRSRQDG
jgi:hypothetical protein